MLRLREFGRLRKKTVLVAVAAIALVLATAAGVLLLGSRILNAQTPFFPRHRHQSERRIRRRDRSGSRMDPFLQPVAGPFL